MTRLAPDSPAAIFVGTFLICLSLLAFEVSTVRTINFVIGPSFIYIAIALALLGLTSACSILSLANLSALRIRREYVFFALCLAIALLLILSNVLVVDTKRELNDVVRMAGEAGGLQKIVVSLLFQGTFSALKIGLFLCLPYFLFGGLLSYLFATSASGEYAGLYAADLIGAAVGCVVIVVLMESTSYAFSVTAPAIAALLAAAAFVLPARGTLSMLALGIAVVVAVLPQAPAFRASVEPQSDPNYLVRDYTYGSDVAETWSGWNSYTRVGAIEARDGSGAHATLSLANGDGLAYLWPYQPVRGTPLVHKPAIPAMLLDPPDDILVIFAGAGADLMSLKEFGARRVVGVELNSKVVDGGLALSDYHLSDFLASDGVRLVLAEGRAFLEQDRSKYDTVLISWSGATAAYYMGALAGTTQHIFTYEGLSAILDHLKSDGYAVILQVNKVNMLASLRRYMAEHALPDPERAAIVLFRDGHVRAWDGIWDDNPLLIKPTGWSDEEVARITKNAAEHGLQVAYAPGRPPHPDYGVYERILSADQLDSELQALNRETGLRFSVVPDDRPFYMDLFDTGRYLSGDFWFGFPEKFTRATDFFHLARVLMVLAVTVAAFVLALAPLAFRRGPSSRRRAAGFLLYFLCLGAGFMFLEIGIIQRAGFLFGNPGLTIAIVLCGVILFAGLGSMMSNFSFARGWSFRTIAAAVAVYAIAAGLGLDVIFAAVVGWPLLAKVVVVFVTIAPGALLMGHLFPQGVALAGREDKALVPWAWAINGAMSASVAGVAPLVAQAFGFQSLFMIGAALYAVILLIPIFQPQNLRLASAVATS